MFRCPESGDGVADESRYSVESRIAVLESLLPEKILSNKERTDLLFAKTAEQAGTQFTEFMRRFSELNHEAARLKEMKAELIHKDVYYPKIGDLDKQIVALQMFQSNLLGRMAIAGVLGGLVASVLTALVVKWIAQ